MFCFIIVFVEMYIMIAPVFEKGAVVVVIVW